MTEGYAFLFAYAAGCATIGAAWRLWPRLVRWGQANEYARRQAALRAACTRRVLP